MTIVLEIAILIWFGFGAGAIVGWVIGWNDGWKAAEWLRFPKKSRPF